MGDERGGIVLKFLLLSFLIPLILLCIILFFAVVMFAPARHSSDGGGWMGSAGGGTATDATTTTPVPVDLGTGRLVCAALPGVTAPKTPALDRRVNAMLEAVKADLAGRGIPPLRFTYGFRTTREQELVDPGSNYKAAPGTSPHEAGRAVDVVGMKVRADRGEIIATFRRHGWRWLGMGDPPHFEVPAETVGEPDRFVMIRKAQADFEAGNPVGCRGRGMTRPRSQGFSPEERARRAANLFS